MSFFDDDEDTAPRPSTPPPASRAGAAGAAGGPSASSTRQQRPRPRSPQRPRGSPGADQHTLVVRRRVAAGVGVVVLIVIVLLINGCLKSEKQQALKNYNSDVNQLATETTEHVSDPLFSTLTGAAAKSALNVEEDINQCRLEMEKLASKASGFSTPSAMAGAQRNLLLVTDLRVEGVTKIAALLPTALGSSSQAKQATTLIAGDMEIFLASDVVYSQRVAPLIQQTLSSNGISGLTTSSSHFLPNLGWLEPTTVQSRIGGQAASATTTPQSGHHGSALKSVMVGTTTLEPEPTINHITGGPNPTFTVGVENSGEFEETNVKVDATVTASGKQFKASHVIEKTEPGKTVSVDIPVTGVPLGPAAKVEIEVEPVPGETNHEDTKDTFLAVFEH